MKLYSLVLGLAGLSPSVLGQSDLEPRDLPECPGEPINEIVATTVYVFPVFISTYIDAATVININGNADITINNAPTTLITEILATSTVIDTVTVSTTVTVVPSASGVTTEPTPFVLQTTPQTAARLRKRQNDGSTFGGYAQDGHLTAACVDGTQFALNAGQLTANGQIVSTSPGVNFAPLLSGTDGSINTGFSVVGSFIVWNSAFFSGFAAEFCVTADGTLNAVFNEAEGPADCIFVDLVVVPTSFCPQPSITTSSVTSSTTSSMMNSTSATVGPSGSLSTTTTFSSNTTTTISSLTGTSSSVNGTTSATTSSQTGTILPTISSTTTASGQPSQSSSSPSGGINPSSPTNGTVVFRGRLHRRYGPEI